MEALKEIANSPAILKEVYGDLAKPGVQQAGKALATVIGLGNTLLWPLMLLNEKARIALEANLEKYRKRMEQVPDSEVSCVPPEVGVPIAEKLTYVNNEELSNMYVELLAKASQKQSTSLAHPSFVNIISNLSPDEAILLKSLRNMPGIPFIEVRFTVKGKNEWITLDPMRAGISCLGELQFPGNIGSYISNLDGLGILKPRQDIYMIGDGIYEPLEESAKAAFSKVASAATDRELTFSRGKIEITPFASLLMDACFYRQNP